MVLFFRKSHRSDELSEVSTLKPGDWVNVIEPSKTEIETLVKKHELPREFIHAALDPKERSRIDHLGKAKLFIIRIPVKEENKYFVIPVGVIITESNIYTICAKPNQILNSFLTEKIEGFYTTKRIRFVLYLIQSANRYFDKYVEELYSYTERLETKLLRSERNIEVVSFLEVQKTITYFHSALINNGVLFERIINNNKKIEIYQEDKELLEDMIIENKELLETVSIFMNNLGNTMDAYASIISNNLNMTMKFLTSLTIILTLPTIVTSFYGMNIKLPFAESPLAYILIILLCVISVLGALYSFMKRNWL